ncbi:hypothetical protein Tco_0645623 [Tanacetum coccineum]
MCVKLSSSEIDVNKVLHLKKQISNHMEGKQMYINGTINRDTLAWSKDEQSRLDGLNKYSIQLLRLSLDGKDQFTSYDEVCEIFDAMGFHENLLMELMHMLCVGFEVLNDCIVDCILFMETTIALVTNLC